MITITKHPDGFQAVVTRENGIIEWRTTRPVDEPTLRSTLYDMGHHMVDVTEAFLAADAERARKFRSGTLEYLTELVGADEVERARRAYERRVADWENKKKKKKSDQ